MNVLCVDIGGTFIKYAVMDEKMEILSRGKVPTPQDGRDELIEEIGTVYDSCEDVDGISISMPGIIDSENGYCVMGGALRYNDDFYMRNRLFERCPVPIHMENDAKCAAKAEATLGSLKDVEDGVVLIFGTMVGGGFVKNHKLHRGKHFSAGEVSYAVTVRDGEPTVEDVWGNRCGTPALCRMYAEKKGIDPTLVDGITVFDAVAKGDRDAIDSLKAFTKEIAVQIFNIQTFFDPEKIAIGGGISAQPVFLEYINEHLKKMYANCIYHVPKASVVCTEFQNDANLYGAMQCFLAE